MPKQANAPSVISLFFVDRLFWPHRGSPHISAAKGLTECQLIPSANSIITLALIHQSGTVTNADLLLPNDVRRNLRLLYETSV